jgi:hypothetical protein
VLIRTWVPPQSDDVYGETPVTLTKGSESVRSGYMDIVGITGKDHKIFWKVISPKVAKSPI